MNANHKHIIIPKRKIKIKIDEDKIKEYKRMIKVKIKDFINLNENKYIENETIEKKNGKECVHEIESLGLKMRNNIKMVNK